MPDNCDYHGRLYYNGEVWYSAACHHCACSYGRVICTRIECEATFCLSNEILVRKKKVGQNHQECCVECRAPVSCQVNSTFSLLEGQVWMNESAVQKNTLTVTAVCELCECTSTGQLQCFQKSCQTAKYPTYALLKLANGERKTIDATTVPFLADFIKSFDKKSKFFITAGPGLSTLFTTTDSESTGQLTSFTLQDLALSKVFYEAFEDNEVDSVEKRNDFVVLTFVSVDNRTVQNILVEFELTNTDELTFNGPKVVNLDRTIRDHDLPKSVKSTHLAQQTPRKTIFIQPGEAIKLTSGELKPRNLPAGVTDKQLVYFLVSGSPRYGELKLKKLFSSAITGGSEDMAAPAGWSKVNDIYLEKPVKEFTQLDLDNGNVWYEPFNDFTAIQNNEQSPVSSTNGNNLFTKKCSPGRVGKKSSFDSGGGGSDEDDTGSSECVDEVTSQSVTTQSGGKYDHCLFEVYDQARLGELLSKEIIHFSVHSEVINETVLGLEAIEAQHTPLASANFDVAGIDSTREHLVYRVIKPLERNQGQLEQKSRPGVSVDTFTQAELNRGLVLYVAPKEIGTVARDFLFTFVGKWNFNKRNCFAMVSFLGSNINQRVRVLGRKIFNCRSRIAQLIESMVCALMSDIDEILRFDPRRFAIASKSSKDLAKIVSKCGVTRELKNKMF
jgi:hypothetical protein